MGNQMCCVDRVRHPGDVDFPMQKNPGEGHDLPLVTVIKFQAIARGFLVRNRIKKSHGFSKRPGFVHGHANRLTQDERDAMRKRVFNKRATMPEFQYGKLAGEDDEFGPQQSVIKLPDGSEYEGEWADGKRLGRGMQIVKDGSIFEGYWKNDMPNGRGRMIHADCSVYEGFWTDGKANGKGIFTYSDGSYYEGDWKDNYYHGQGRENWPDGSQFTGSYVNGMKTG